jgi:magnesium-protoporphyrin IX monomethyl ester (oxidative) cyclase
MAKILLAHAISPIVNTSPPLGLGYIGAALEKHGYEVKIIDGGAPYAEYDLESMVDEIARYEPDLIGLTLTVSFALHTYRLISELKKRLDVPIIVGGPHATILPEEPLQYGADIVCRGEGEQCIVELVDYFNGDNSLTPQPPTPFGKGEMELKNRKTKSAVSVANHKTKSLVNEVNILGISYKDEKGNIIHNPPRPLCDNLDILDFPAKHLFNKAHYFRDESDSARFGNMVTSRGCPYGCTYCSNEVFGRRWRSRSPQNVVAEIKQLMETYGTRKFNLMDDAATIDQKRIMEICQLIIDNKLDIQWTCVTRLNATSPELLAKMKEAGCVNISYGIESGNPDTLKHIKKGLTVEQAEQAVKYTHEAGVECSVNFMYGFPWETPEDIRRTTEFIKKIRPYITYIQPGGVLTPYPATQIYNEYHEEYGFTDWWLKERTEDSIRSETGEPLFQRIFFDYDAIEQNWFNYPPEIIKEIIRAAEVVGRHNLLYHAHKLTSSSILAAIIREGIYTLVKVSRATHRISPKAARIFSKPFLNIAEKYHGK